MGRPTRGQPQESESNVDNRRRACGAPDRIQPRGCHKHPHRDRGKPGQADRGRDRLIQSQDLSAQSVELATPLTDRLLFADLLSAYNAELDRQCFRASGASGELLGI
jgi:hypothetical protein